MIQAGRQADPSKVKDVQNRTDRGREGREWRGEREGTVNVFWNDVTARRSSDAKLNPSAAASELPNLS